MEDVKVALLSFFLARGRVFQGLRDRHHQQGPDSVCGVNPFSMDPIGEGNLLKNSSANSVFLDSTTNHRGEGHTPPVLLPD